MSFYDWSSLQRASLFGGAFLLVLFAVLWLWYDSSAPRRQNPAWWRAAGSVLVVLTIPAVFIGAANLDSSRETLLNVLGWLGIGSAVAALAVVAGYAAWGRTETAIIEHATLPLPPRAPAPPPPTVLPATELQSRSTSKPVVALGYLFVKAGSDQGRQFPLAESARIGRAADCAVVLDDRRVSSEHALLRHANGQFVFTDLRSANGSFLLVEGREEQIRAPQVLVDGDLVRVGHTVLEFVDAKNGRRQE